VIYNYVIINKKERFKMQTVTLPQIEIDNSILLLLNSSAEELAYKMKFYTAVALYQKQKLSLSKSAEFVGIDRLDFIKALQDEDIPVFDYSNQQMDEIIDDAQQLLSENEIKKIVENSQRIEGYEPVSKEIQEEAKSLMRRYNVKISA
jgi:predicted HTH domain antitoxin